MRISQGTRIEDLGSYGTVIRTDDNFTTIKFDGVPSTTTLHTSYVRTVLTIVGHVNP